MKPKFKHVEGEGPEVGYRVHTTFEHKNATKPQLSSVLEQNSLEEFVNLAKLSQRNFAAERGGATVVEQAKNVNENEGMTETMIDKFMQDKQVAAGSNY